MRSAQHAYAHACPPLALTPTLPPQLHSEVYRGYYKATQAPVAIKVIDLENAEDEIDDIQQEISILSQLDSDHVTKSVRRQSAR